MKNKNLILIVGAAAVAAFFLMRRKGGNFAPGGAMAPGAGPVDIEKTDAVIDADKQKISLSDAVEAVSAVSDKIKDLKVQIKKDGKTTTVRTGKKQKAGGGRKKIKPTRKAKTKKGRAGKRVKDTAQSIARQAIAPITKAFEPSQRFKNVGKQFANLFPSF